MAEDLKDDFLTIRDLSFSFENCLEVLKEVHFSISEGEILALVGPSGCGKTTLIRLIAGLLSPKDGSIRIGNWAAGSTNLIGKIAFLSQSPTLIPWRTVTQNVRLPHEFERVLPSHFSVENAIEMVGLAGFENSYPAQLSGGMSQRAVMARLMVAVHSLILLDEPFASLDDFSRQALGELFLEIHRLQKFTSVIVTHSIEEAVFLADKILILSNRPGRVLSEHRIKFDSPRNKLLLECTTFYETVQEIRSKLP